LPSASSNPAPEIKASLRTAFSDDDENETGTESLVPAERRNSFGIENRSRPLGDDIKPNLTSLRPAAAVGFAKDRAGGRTFGLAEAAFFAARVARADIIS
jgi:hypothetical protein